MKKVVLLIVGLFVLCIGAAFGQTTINGTVYDETGESVVGAAVQVKGTTKGAVTDMDGKFSVEVTPENKTLVISYMGYKTVEIEGRNGMSVHLEVEATTLTEVIVQTGYDAQAKTTQVGSNQQISGEVIEKKSPSDVTKGIAGEFAGVSVTNSSGQPGTVGAVRIRGAASVNASTDPLYVIDGVPYSGTVANINPADIASTTVLKDATATALYGARGANGVIVITTKKGTAGAEGKIDVDVKYGANMRLLPMYETITSPEEYVELGWRSLFNQAFHLSGVAENIAKRQAGFKLFGTADGVANRYNLWKAAGRDLINPETGKFYDGIERKYTPESWRDYIFRTGSRFEADVKFHGGSDKTTYYTSIGYLKDEGYYIASNFNRLTVRSNIDYQPKKWLKGNMNMSYAYYDINNPGQGENMNNGFAYVNETPPIYPVLQHDPITGELVNDPLLGGWAYDYGNYGRDSRGYGLGINPAGALHLDKQKTSGHQFSLNALFEAQLYKGNSNHATHDLKLSANVGYQYFGRYGYSLTNMFYGDAEGVGRLSRSYLHYMNLTANQILRYMTVIADDHTISAFVAHEAMIDVAAESYGSVSQLLLPEGVEWSNGAVYDELSSGTDRERMESYFGQLNYNYKERYLFQGSLRGDGCSQFAAGHRWGLFYGVGLGWMISNEDFVQNSNAKEWLKTLKYKISYGVTGNNGIGSYNYVDLYGIGKLNQRPTLQWSTRGNPNLTWESTANFNTGFEFGFFKDERLSGEIEFYNRNVHNLLFPRRVAPSLGYTSYYVNDGILVLRGVEFLLNAKIVKTNKVSLDFRVTGAFERDKMKQLPIDHDGSTKRMIMNGSMSVGHSRYSWLLPVWAGVDEATGKAQYWHYFDPANTDEVLTNIERYMLEHPNAKLDSAKTTAPIDPATYAGDKYVRNAKGKVLRARPDIFGGFGFNLSVYGVELSTFFEYQIGGYGYDASYATLMHSDQFGSRNWHIDTRNSWTETNTHTDVPRLSNGYDLYANYGSSRFLTSLTALRLANVRLGYNLPTKAVEKMKLKSLGFYITGDNLFVLSARKGYNPFASYTGGSSTYSYSPLSTIIGGIKLQF